MKGYSNGNRDQSSHVGNVTLRKNKASHFLPSDHSGRDAFHRVPVFPKQVVVCWWNAFLPNSWVLSANQLQGILSLAMQKGGEEEDVSPWGAMIVKLGLLQHTKLLF